MDQKADDRGKGRKHDAGGPPVGGGGDPTKPSEWDPISEGPAPPAEPVDAMPPRARQLETQNGPDMKKLFDYLLND